MKWIGPTILWLITILFLFSYANAQEVGLIWTPNPEPDIYGYRIY